MNVLSLVDLNPANGMALSCYEKRNHPHLKIVAGGLDPQLLCYLIS